MLTSLWLYTVPAPTPPGERPTVHFRHSSTDGETRLCGEAARMTWSTGKKVFRFEQCWRTFSVKSQRTSILYVIRTPGLNTLRYRKEATVVSTSILNASPIAQ